MPWPLPCCTGLERTEAPDVDMVRVVVGRGNHSAGGEAVLPRAVEGHLVRCRRKFALRGGSIEVQLHPRRPAARRHHAALQTR